MTTEATSNLAALLAAKVRQAQDNGATETQAVAVVRALWLAHLTDNEDADFWLRQARLDGRFAGTGYDNPHFQRDGWHMYMTPPDAARGLWLLTYIDDNDQADWTEYPDLSKATWV